MLENHKLEDQYFGEGITELNGKIYQLTWKNGVGFIYDAAEPGAGRPVSVRHRRLGHHA